MSPISVEALLRDGGKQGGHGGRILDVMRASPGQAWRAVELSDALGIDQHTLGAVLRRLRARGRLDKHSNYWFLPSERDAARLAAVGAATRDLNKRLGKENPKHWPSLPPK